MTLQQKTSGYQIYRSYRSIVNKEMTQEQLEKLQAKWLTLVRGPTKKLVNYTTRVREFADKFANTTININQAAIKWRWQLGLGHSFENLNKHIRLTKTIPAGWEEDQPLTDLLETAVMYLKEEGLSELKPQ
eukprot:13127534-Ditylum_brightwellii.AAC.1